jgi:hypothetical protein
MASSARREVHEAAVPTKASAARSRCRSAKREAKTARLVRVRVRVS